MGSMEFVQEGGEAVVDGFPFDMVAAGWVHGFGEVFLVVSQTFVDVRDDLGRGWIVVGNENAQFVAAHFERRQFIIVMCIVHVRPSFYGLGATRRPAMAGLKGGGPVG